MKNPLKHIKSFILEPLSFYLDILKSNGSLRLEGYEDKNSILINDYFEKLYCLELSGAGENIQFLPDSLIDSLSSDFENDELGEFTWVLVKDGIYKKNLIFSKNKKIINLINANIKAKILEFEEIANVLLSLYFSNEYDIDYRKKTLQQKYKIMLKDEYKNPLNSYNAMLRERVLENYHNTKFYQAISYDNSNNTQFDIVNFFNVKFEGALFTKVILNKNSMKKELESQKSNTVGQLKQTNKKIIEKLIDSLKVEKRFMINTTLMVKEDYNNNVSNIIERFANCTFDLVRKDHRKLCNKTAILAYNENFSRVIKKSFLYQYISSNSKLDSDKPDIVGTNIDNSFVNFGFKKATEKNSIPKAHTILLGTSGAGKTQAANDILKQLVGFDYEENEVYNIDKTNHVIFDIKDSFYNQINAIKACSPDIVDMNDFDKNSFMYNIVDCETVQKNGKIFIDEGDLTFSSILISLILASSSSENNTLTTGESEEYKDVLKQLYTYDNYEKMSVLYIVESHPKEYEELINLGYDDFTTFDEIKDEKFKKFNKPLLYNVINVLKERLSNYKLENRNLKLQLAESLIYKLETIEQIGIFSNFSKLNFENKPIIYFRTDSLLDGSSEEYGYMVFAMLSIVTKMVKKKQHQKRIDNKPRPMVYFWFEEARNIFANKLFHEKEVFERVINEWRSFDMVFFPITQEPQHIPDTILNGFEIKMLLISGDDEEEKGELLNNLTTRLSIGDKRRKILERLPKYTMMVMYGDGAFTIKFKDDENFRNLVNT